MTDDLCPRCGGPLVDPTPDGGDHHGADHDICGPCWQAKADRDYERMREMDDAG